MVYAAERIRDRAIRAARLMDDHLATEAARIGVPDHDALGSYEQGRQGAPTGRQARATDEQRRWATSPPTTGKAGITPACSTGISGTCAAGGCTNTTAALSVAK